MRRQCLGCTCPAKWCGGVGCTWLKGKGAGQAAEGGEKGRPRAGHAKRTAAHAKQAAGAVAYVPVGHEVAEKKQDDARSMLYMPCAIGARGVGENVKEVGQAVLRGEQLKGRPWRRTCKKRTAAQLVQVAAPSALNLPYAMARAEVWGWLVIGRLFGGGAGCCDEERKGAHAQDMKKTHRCANGAIKRVAARAVRARPASVAGLRRKK
jgi:hypothetical protein